MKLRVLKKGVYVSAAAQQGWGAKSIDKSKDVLQMWDDKEGWIDVPIASETHNIYEHSHTIDNF